MTTTTTIDALNPVDETQFSDTASFVVQGDDGTTAKVLVGEMGRPGISVKLHGAAGDGVTDDTTAFISAITAANLLANANGAAIFIPTGTYLITGASPLPTLGNGLRITGMGQPTINFTGTGALFTLSSSVRVELDHFQIYGTFATNTVAIRHTGAFVVGAHYHHLVIQNFGDGTTGGGISMECDSLGCEVGPKVVSSCLTVQVIVTGAGADTLWVHDNIFGTPLGHTTGPCRAVVLNSSGGATTMKVEHNNITTEGLGAIQVNSGNVLLIQNEIETSHPIANSSNASIELLGTSQTSIIGGTVNLHSQTGATYCVYFADTVTNSKEEDVTYDGYNTAAVRVNATFGNIFGPSTSATDNTTLYSGDALGIRQRAGIASVGHSRGYATPPTTGYGRNGVCADGPTNYVASETGTNNTLAAAGPQPLASGLRLTIQLAHSLQAGANTLNWNTGGNVAIKSARNPSNNIATGYASTGAVTLHYNGSAWLDVSQ